MSAAPIRLDGFVSGHCAGAVLDGVRLGIAAGDNVALVDPSGCGTSTPLRLIAGLEHP